MSSIYITSKKRLDSRLLWLVGILILGLAAGLMYYWLSPVFFNKTVENKQDKNQNSQIMPGMNATASSSAPMPGTPNDPKSNPEASAQESKSTQVIPNPNNSDSTPIPGITSPQPLSGSNKSIENTMSNPTPTNKPALTMEEILKQSNP